MRICNEMAQIQVPDRLSESTVNAIYRASKMKKRKKYKIRYSVRRVVSLDENIGRIAIYGKTDGITKVPREEFDNTISVYIIDNSILERAGKRIPNREDFEEYAIVKAIIDLQ